MRNFIVDSVLEGASSSFGLVLSCKDDGPYMEIQGLLSVRLLRI